MLNENRYNNFSPESKFKYMTQKGNFSRFQEIFNVNYKPKTYFKRHKHRLYYFVVESIWYDSIKIESRTIEEIGEITFNQACTHLELYKKYENNKEEGKIFYYRYSLKAMNLEEIYIYWRKKNPNVRGDSFNFNLSSGGFEKEIIKNKVS